MTPSGYRPRFGVFHLIFIIGISIAGYYGHALWTWPEYSDRDIEQSVELNLAIDLSRRGPHLMPDEAGLQRLREQIHGEITGELSHQRIQAERRLGVGLLLTVAGALRLLMTRNAPPGFG